ncbi:DUF3618 domain-containing protein [Streptosporangium sp. NBC_01469]|uniref:DUF3618 domain-containing protein n=1 Tax=Streptosporangium sp. NBC_01469 TaxID=2903898 RepID=UPI002E2BE6CC|nr:DUF3618 domain-containing protein [Streptosporangium sp. NBC_01469]
MTETDPGGPDRLEADAGTTGSRRKGVDEPITPDESGSLNIPPNQPDGSPREDLGVPESERDGTPRLAGTTATTTPYANTGGTGGTGGGAAGTGRTVGGDGNDRETVRRDIEDARRELGDTVEALVHKTDVKGRFQETAAQVGDDLRKVGAATATTATEMVERVKVAAPEMVERVKVAAPEMVERVKVAAPEMVGRVKEAAPEVVGRVREVTPAEIKDAAGRVTTEAGKRPVVTIAAVAALFLVVLRVLRRGKNKKRK